MGKTDYKRGLEEVSFSSSFLFSHRENQPDENYLKGT